MSFKSKTRSQPKDSSAFSNFIRTASSKEKKRVYSKVIKKSIESQKKVLENTTD